MAEVPPTDTIINFKNPVPPFIADPLIHKILKEVLPELKIDYPELGLNPIYNDEKFLIGIDFFIPLTDELKPVLSSKIRRFIYLIQREISVPADRNNKRSNDLARGMKSQPVSFTDLLGTFRIRIKRVYIPILVCIFSAIFLAWLTTYKAGVVINASLVDPEESTVGGTILNALLPVLISAVFITIIYLVVKKFGLNVFRVIMGLIVLVYTWFGFTFYLGVVYTIIWDVVVTTDASGWFYYILYYSLFYGSAVGMAVMGYKFFKGTLGIGSKNMLVLLFGLFFGSIYGVVFPTWTTFLFAIFLSLWDLIAVFKGPLGKMADIMMDNRAELGEKIKEKLEKGEISQLEAEEMGQFVSLSDTEISQQSFKEIADEIEIELGSGDLILYSALVAHVFIKTLSWFVTSMVMIGVLGGAVLTLYYLIVKRRILPALPFSMFLGIGMFFLAQGILLLI